MLRVKVLSPHSDTTRYIEVKDWQELEFLQYMKRILDSSQEILSSLAPDEYLDYTSAVEISDAKSK